MNNTRINIFPIRWKLVLYDLIVFALADLFLFVIYGSNDDMMLREIIQQTILALLCIFTCRIIGKVYKQVWRYGGVQCYVRIIFYDAIAFVAYLLLEIVLPIEKITFARLLAFSSVNLLGALTLRIGYSYAYKRANRENLRGRFLRFLLKTFAEMDVEAGSNLHKIKVAVIGAGNVGVSLAEELLSNKNSAYIPVCFVETDKNKIGKEILAIPVIAEEGDICFSLKALEVQEVIFAFPESDVEKSQKLYAFYKELGYKIKTYDYPTMHTAGGKRHLREFDVEDLLFRKPITVANKKIKEYYSGKIILITGGGGSIGSELCRQIARMEPKQLIILDIFENGAYDVQQELRIAYRDKLDLKVEITSITNEKGMRAVFEKYHPQIVINAAAHKHVPLMEHNCVEAVENNVFGTKVVIEMCEEYGAERFMMVSTDKAVNPTNVMGATKRMCEMMGQSASTWGKVKYSATRFGNVLGSAGSVIPLFKRQIANGGPVTITDKRIIRYFMTIPEASQLVLESGCMAKNGELFVLDMGQPVKIYDLAESMIHLSGVSGVEIVEVGLRPGEKLYEELLVKSEELYKTENKLIFIEKDEALSKEEIDEKLRILKEACESGDNDQVREALRKAVPTFKKPEEVNAGVS